MKANDKRKVFASIADTFETNSIKEYFLDMCEKIPDYIFTMPSSTSGKFHNSTQCQKFGQVYHAMMFSKILEYRLNLEGNKNKYNTPEIRDCMRCVPVFHDAVKCGWNGSQYTVQNHPVLASEWVIETTVAHDIPQNLKDEIAAMCLTHSGEWNTSKSGAEIMPKPRNDMELFIHECDILSSRADIDWIIPQEFKDILEEVEKNNLPDINEYRLNFGKHEGKTLPEILALDKGYIVWAKENIRREPVASLLQQL